MVRYYPAVFKPSQNDGNCSIYFPDLDHECEVSYSNSDDLKKSASEELGFALWMCEDAGRRIPAPKTAEIADVPEGAYVSEAGIDYEAFKKGMSVRVIDLSA
ncbi:MAG: hypothetical protein IJT02_04685 [Synergistaceae bacterium]|nr:hypothetical protein [Synergistaceae bacterium]